MAYGYVYVAQVAMGANQAQYLKAIREAEALQNQHVHRIGNLTLTAYNFYNPLVNEKITSPNTPLNSNTLIVPILPE